jgi:hypothetical protein
MLILLLSVFLLSGCLNNQSILLLSYAEWYTTTEEIGNLTFGYVHLDLSGSTTGDKVTVITYGDTAYKGSISTSINLESEELTYLE